MIVLSGQLGNASLGSSELGRAPVYGTFVPHRGRARSSISADVPGAANHSGNRAHATTSANTPGSSVRTGNQPRSTISARTVRGEVDDG